MASLPDWPAERALLAVPERAEVLLLAAADGRPGRAFAPEFAAADLDAPERRAVVLSAADRDAADREDAADAERELLLARDFPRRLP